MSFGRALCVVWFAGTFAACGSSEAASPNSMLERWCADHPCGWDVDGDSKRVGTWHPDDYAIELVSDDAALSQLRPELDATLAKCFAFSLMAKIDDGARAFFELDFLDDGEPEFSERIPKSHWEVRTFTITTPTWYEGVRFIVRKDGPDGEVIVAELNVELRPDRCNGEPLPLLHRPVGASCADETECESGSCVMQPSDGGMCD